jgi:rare lipoprotein A
VSPQFRRCCAYFFASSIVLQLAACAGRQEKEPAAEAEPHDGPPAISLRASDVLDAQPADEPLAPYGNQSPYEVFGKKYYVLESSNNYVQRGTASWYGTKFHGRRTSSGEPYDLRLATAAHKTLPLPTYAEVTNLENGRKVIVKINDRGPFKDGRLIDLSYGAALRLDMTGTGTAPVEVRVIDTQGLQFAATEPDKISETWLQVGAYGERDGAEDVARRLTKAKLKPVSIQSSQNMFRVWLGPYASNNEINSIIEKAVELGFERPYKVSR